MEKCECVFISWKLTMKIHCKYWNYQRHEQAIKIDDRNQVNI